jgi:hypothetical protein
MKINTSKPFAVLLTKLAGGGFGVCVSEDNGVNCAPTEATLVYDIQTSMAEFGSRGYESSMSACLHSMTFNYHTIMVQNKEDMMTLLGEGPWTIEGVRHVSGSLHYIKTSKDAQARLDADATEIPMKS